MRQLQNVESYKSHFLSIFSGSVTEVDFENTHLELLSNGHPLSQILDQSLCELPCVLISKIQQDVKQEEDSRTESLGESFEGSPLRLDTFDTQNGSQGRTSSTSDQQHSHLPLTVEKARWIISEYNIGMQDSQTPKPVCVLVDGKDEDGTVFIGSSIKQSAAQNLPEIHMFSGTVKEPSMRKWHLSSPETVVKELGFSDIYEVNSSARAVYDILKAPTHDSTLFTHQGALRIVCEWKKLTLPLQVPPPDANTFIEAEVVPGDMTSAAYSFYSDIILLKGLARGLEDDTVHWKVSSDNVPVIERLKTYIEQLRAEDGKETWENAGDLEEESPLEQVILAPRTNLDFIEKLWDILKDCHCYHDLVTGLKLVLRSLRDGSLRPSVHNTSCSQLAKVVSSAHLNAMQPLPLDGLRPLELLLEIGLEKVTLDHVHQLVSNRLVSEAQLNKILSTASGTLEKLLALEKVHRALDLAITLNQLLDLPTKFISYGVREVLKYFEDHPLEDGHLFVIPVTMRNVKVLISKLQPTNWRMELSTKESPTEHAVLQLSPEPLFHTAQKITLTKNPEDSEDGDLLYYQTTVRHEVFIM